MSDVFISYVEEDSAIAQQIANELDNAGFTTWYYERDSLVGTSYLLQTGEAIDKCKAIVILISRASLGSYHITKEVERGYEAEKHFIPILVDVSYNDLVESSSILRQVLGTRVSISIPLEGVSSVIARVIKGLEHLGIHPIKTSDKDGEKNKKLGIKPHQQSASSKAKLIGVLFMLILLAGLITTAFGLFKGNSTADPVPEGITHDEIIEFVERWCSSQDHRDTSAYKSCYSTDFQGEKLGKTGKEYEYDYEDWIENRTTMINRTSWLDVDYSDLYWKLQEDPNLVIIWFTQMYRSDRYSDQGYKVMKLQKTPTGLKIVYEKMLSSSPI